jgi:hypothetical protein
MANLALSKLTELHKLQLDNSKKMTTIKNEFDSQKTAVFEYMKNNKLTFVETGNREYLVVETKKSKPTMNSELLGVSYQLHCRDNLKKQCSPEEIQAFVLMTETVQSRLSTSKEELVFSKSKPMSSLLE